VRPSTGLGRSRETISSFGVCLCPHAPLMNRGVDAVAERAGERQGTRLRALGPSAAKPPVSDDDG
jgi:hypothetical protein